MTNQPDDELKTLIDRLVACSEEIKLLKDQVHMLEVDRESMKGSCKAMGRDISIMRRQKSQYFRCVKWFLANTKIDPDDIPGPVRHTLVHVAGVLAAKAEKQE